MPYNAPSGPRIAGAVVSDALKATRVETAGVAVWPDATSGSNATASASEPTARRGQQMDWNSERCLAGIEMETPGAAAGTGIV